ALALVTGESLGQVASQTLPSMAVIDAATTLPVLRPLVGMDKTEITARAREIGTYEISILPYEDCCSLFVPAHPRTQPTLAEVEDQERDLAVEPLLAEAVERSTLQEVSPRESPELLPARLA
ncbi:MAG: tRNA 4-thiouridine(8) synthase ThiI, partial [Armatimonadota bacterium]|nr:tRNA 4-thiouridine(8) synthase ThiI [Armatimonadota bacterium]